MNNLYIVGTEFKCPKTGKVQYGYRVYNDTGSHYETGWDSVPNDDLDLLREVVENCEVIAIKEMLIDAANVGNSVNVNGEWYAGEKVAPLLAPVLNDNEEDEEGFAGNYIDYEDCVANGIHMRKVDDDGFCQACGDDRPLAE